MRLYNLNAGSEWQFLVGKFPGQVYYSVVCHCLPRKTTSVWKLFCRGSNPGSLKYQTSALSVTPHLRSNFFSKWTWITWINYCFDFKKMNAKSQVKYFFLITNIISTNMIRHLIVFRHHHLNLHKDIKIQYERVWMININSQQVLFN